MGEARQRKLAKAAGKPWPQDAPPAPKPVPWYMDPHGVPPVLTPRTDPAVVMVPPAVSNPTRPDRLRELAQESGAKVVDKAPRGLPVVRRRSGLEMAAIIAALSMEGFRFSVTGAPPGRPRGQ